MGFYSMTYSISPLGALQAGVLANLIGTPIAIAIGGLAVVGFAAGPATVSLINYWGNMSVRRSSPRLMPGLIKTRRSRRPHAKSRPQHRLLGL